MIIGLDKQAHNSQIERDRERDLCNSFKLVQKKFVGLVLNDLVLLMVLIYTVTDSFRLSSVPSFLSFIQSYAQVASQIED